MSVRPDTYILDVKNTTGLCSSFPAAARLLFPRNRCFCFMFVRAMWWWWMHVSKPQAAGNAPEIKSIIFCLNFSRCALVRWCAPMQAAARDLLCGMQATRRGSYLLKFAYKQFAGRWLCPVLATGQVRSLLGIEKIPPCLFMLKRSPAIPTSVCCCCRRIRATNTSAYEFFLPSLSLSRFSPTHST